MLAAGLALAVGLSANSEGPAPYSGSQPSELLRFGRSDGDAARSALGLLGAKEVAVGIGHAQNWSPSTDRIIWNQASLMLVYDHDPLFPYRPSSSLQWLLEADFGLTEVPENKAVAALGIHALWSPWKPEGWHPFVSGGIGGIYTDWQVQGQALRLNFNPQVGLGAEIGDRWLLTLRVHHLSNANLADPNVGVNSVLGVLALIL